jgi:hypothetical protein
MEERQVKLSSVALVTLVMISIGYLLRISQSFSLMIEHPLTFLSSGIGSVGCDGCSDTGSNRLPVRYLIR